MPSADDLPAAAWLQVGDARTDNRADIIICTAVQHRTCVVHAIQHDMQRSVWHCTSIIWRLANLAWNCSNTHISQLACSTVIPPLQPNSRAALQGSPTTHCRVWTCTHGQQTGSNKQQMLLCAPRWLAATDCACETAQKNTPTCMGGASSEQGRKKHQTRHAHTHKSHRSTARPHTGLTARPVLRGSQRGALGSRVCRRRDPKNAMPHSHATPHTTIRYLVYSPNSPNLVHQVGVNGPSRAWTAQPPNRTSPACRARRAQAVHACARCCGQSATTHRHASLLAMSGHWLMQREAEVRCL